MKQIIIAALLLTAVSAANLAQANWRSAETGRYVTPGYGERNPDTTVRER